MGFFYLKIYFYRLLKKKIKISDKHSVKYLVVFTIALNLFARDHDQIISKCGEYSFSALLVCNKDEYSLVISPETLSKREVIISKRDNISLDYFCHRFISGRLDITNIDKSSSGIIKSLNSTVVNRSSKLKLLKVKSCD